MRTVPESERFLRFQQNRRAKRRRGVEIVAAGVHHTGILRGVIHAGFFFNRQGIDIRTQHHQFAGIDAANFCHQTGFERQIYHADLMLLQYRPDAGGGVKFSLDSSGWRCRWWRKS
jgi:hypothetical protein